jgi:hypothetical protein
MSESNRDWSVAEQVFGEVPTLQPVKVEVTPEPPSGEAPRYVASPQDDLRRVVLDWARRHNLDDGLDIDLRGVDGDAAVVLGGLEFDDYGYIVPKEREYLWTGTITVSVAVSGTVRSRSEDEASELAEYALRNASIDSVEVDGYETDVDYEGHDIYDYDLHDVDEQ